MDVKSDVLINITDYKEGDSLIAIYLIKVAFISHPLTAIPILFQVAKESVISIYLSRVGAEDVTKKQYYFLTIGLFSIAVTIALMVKDLGVAYTFFGACGVMLISSILPSYIGYKCCNDK